MNKDEKLEILFHLHLIQIQELMFRRQREFTIFSWSNSLFVALIGVLAIVEKAGGSAFWKPFGFKGKIIVSLAIFILLFFSISWQNRERKFGNLNARVISNINKLLHVYDKGYFNLNNNTSLFPPEWENWGMSKTNYLKRYFRANLITATWLLGVLCISMILIS